MRGFERMVVWGRVNKSLYFENRESNFAETWIRQAPQQRGDVVGRMT